MARILDSVVGHEEVISSLCRAIAEQKLPSQLVFYGPEGIGKKQVAFGLIQALFCERSCIGENAEAHSFLSLNSNIGSDSNLAQLACGQCGSCLRVAQNTAENLLVIRPEKNLIKIEQSHEILDFLSLQAWTTSKNKITRRAVLIEEAHALNPQAANALLKVFEEPPENTYFFLITHRHRMLLPTIRSRAKMVGFHPLTADQIQKVYPQAENWKILSARGSFQKLLSLDDPSNIRQQAVDCLKLLLEKPDEFIISSWRDQLKDREVAAQYLRWWMLFLRDAAVLSSGLVQASAPSTANVFAQASGQSTAKGSVQDSMQSSSQSSGQSSMQIPRQVISQDQMPIVELLKNYSQEKIHALFSLLLKSESALWAYQDPILLIENIFLSGFYHVGDEVYVD
jgi:DNA polymerase-3 subunit delta'